MDKAASFKEYLQWWRWQAIGNLASDLTFQNGCNRWVAKRIVAMAAGQLVALCPTREAKDLTPGAFVADAE